MRDYSHLIYRILLCKILQHDYQIIPFANYCKNLLPRFIILRHDVDRNPILSMRMAEIETDLNIRGSYFFRIRAGRFPELAIKKISDLGHEVGYHYEDLDIARGNVEMALRLFKRNLERLRQIVPVRTICMHGSPMSKYDNRDMWKQSSYKEFGIIGEPYFDVDFSKVMYLTDTGRRWDGAGVSIRDKVRGDGLGVRGERTEDRGQKAEDRENEVIKRPRLHSTQDIINALKNNELPDQIMMTIHPQRWTNAWGPWLWELVSQKIKNVVKYFIVRYRRTQVRGDG